MDLEEEFEALASELLQAVRKGLGRQTKDASRDGRPVRRQPMTPERIAECALSILDREGRRAVTIRRVADEIRISTRTLYQRFSSREAMIASAVALHYSKLALVVGDAGQWNDIALEWSVRLHHELLDHPHVTDLTPTAKSNVLRAHTDELATLMCKHGLDRQDATKYAGLLADFAVASAVKSLRSAYTASPAERLRMAVDFRASACLLIAGLQSQLESIRSLPAKRLRRGSGRDDEQRR